MSKAISIRELRKKCQDKGNGRFYSDWSEYLPRTFSIYFTKFFIKVGVSANQVTVISIIVGLASAVLIALASALSMAIAGMSIFLFTILDCSDGEVARYHGTQSYTGLYLDRFAAACVDPAVLFAIGVNVSCHTAGVWGLIAAFIGALYLLLSRICVSYVYLDVALDIVEKRPVSLALGAEDPSMPESEFRLEKPHFLRRLPVIDFVADLFVAKGWGIIFWIWVASLVSLSSLVFGHPDFMREILSPLIVVYACGGPIVIAWAVWSTTKACLPDRFMRLIGHTAKDKKP